MKTPTLLFTTACIGCATILFSSAYNGARDERLPPEDSIDYSSIILDTTFGMLVKLSDSGGVGTVTGRGFYDDEHKVEYFTVRVDQAFWGCSNGQILKIYEDERKGFLDTNNQMVDNYPTNHAQFVFVAATNLYETLDLRVYDWNTDVSQLTINRKCPMHVLNQCTRSWWYVDYQDGYPFIYFTNVVHTMRTQRNWTNYYEICRSGASIGSNRVKEDSFYDLRFLIGHATDEQLDFMNNDSLFPANNRPFLEEEIAERQQKK